MELKFFMPMDPPTITHQEKQIKMIRGKPIIYEPQELKTARQKLLDSLVPNRPQSPLDGPIELVVTWCFPTDREELNGQYRITKPDTDNLDKMLKDCMTSAGFWKDDAQVCREIIEKFWTHRNMSGIFVRVTQL